ncbi:MAG: SpoIIE family protein phosphatase [Candidatus Binataceae bacterium]
MTASKSPSESRTEPLATLSLAGWRAPGRRFALAVLVLLCAVRLLDPSVIAIMRLRGFDLEQQLAPRIYQPLSVPVRIVAIDDSSVAHIGQWPWPRKLMANLVDRIAAGHPRVLGVDIIFSEPDRFSPAQLASLPGLPKSVARELAELPSSEQDLAAAFRKVPTVLGVGMSNEPGAGTQGRIRVAMVREIGADPRPYLWSYAGLVRSLPELMAAQRAEGVLAGAPDRDGIVRRVPLFVIGERRLVPSLMLGMLQVAFGGSLGIVTGREGVRGATLGDLFMPTDRHALAYPYFTPSLDVRYVPAGDLLDGSYDPDNLRNALVLLGVTGLGLVDEKQTPLGLMPGVEVGAQLLESILTGNLLHRPVVLEQIEIALMIAAALAAIFLLPYRNPRIAVGIFAALIVALIGLEYASFRILHLLLDGVYPALGVIVTFGVMLGASLRAAEAARRRLAVDLEHEREAKARIEGELNAARAIQMGLLPRHFIGFPDRRDVDIYAVIEPARMVGGDLYDFVMLDSYRLSFAIADVSGKGVPAALFMAMSKEVLRAATLSHGDALDKVFAEANARIAAASNDMAGVGANMMFVTVFAGVLDLASGRLVYVSAGHDSPFVLSPQTQAQRLPARGGPPLGSVEDFPYPVEERQLVPGEMLLLYTDGVTEAENAQHGFYTEARLEQVLASAPVDGARAAVDFVRNDVRHFSEGAEQADDITLLAVRWLGARNG